MSNKKTTILTTIICLIPIFLGIAFYGKMPAQIATHWDANGVPNGWSSKFVGAIVFPGILAVVNLLLPLLLRTDPKYKNMGYKLKTLVQWIIPLVSLFCSGITLASALDIEVPVAVIAPMFFGVLMIIIGNYLPKTGQSYTLGIRIPWTLASEENWKRTHRLGGFVFVIGGFLMILSSVLSCRAYVFTACMIIMVLVPCIYSFVLFKKGI